ncbi:MAG: hypothetical protein MUP71_12225 [Candidatus Aminicenantes bacterium]|nr:hypothetical protein [Candidatus Aminicenantes bacterium]
MPGTWLISSVLFLSLLMVPAANPAAGRQHEIQLRRNDYMRIPAPAQLQRAELSKAILRVFSDDEKKGGLYFDSGLFPVVRPALQQWTREFASGPVSFWAWMGTRKFAWLDHAGLLDTEWSERKPQLIPKLDLFNPQAQDLIVKLFAQLAHQPIQGILVQDDLTLLIGEGFSNWGKASFTRSSGLAADPKRMLTEGSLHNRVWEDLKVGRVAETFSKLVTACRQANPAIQIGLNVHYEAPLTPQRARSWYAFDARVLNTAGVDLFYLMAYHRQIKAEMKLLEGDSRIYFRLMLEAALKSWGNKLAVKLQVRDWQTSELIPFSELKTYYDLIPAGVERVCFAAADPDDIDLISRIITKNRDE